MKINKKIDNVAIIAPASTHRDSAGNKDIKKSKEELDFAINLFSESGFNCKYDTGIFKNEGLEYFSSTKQDRQKQFTNYLSDEEIKIISCLRGGYGSAQIALESLSLQPSTDKILIGFSDITAMHLLFNQIYKMPSIHGLASKTYAGSMPELNSILAGKNSEYQLTSFNTKSENDAIIDGEIFGGNLSVLCSMIGTNLSPNFDGKIIFLEDVCEPGYKIHRMLLQLKYAGTLDTIKALILSDFTKSDKFLEESLDNFCSEYLAHIPIFRMSGIGHGVINRPITLGSNAYIKDKKLVVSSPFKIL